jgi:hypothetical protein
VEEQLVHERGWAPGGRLPTVVAGTGAALGVGGFALLLVLGPRIGWSVSPATTAAETSDLYDVRAELPWMASLVVGIVVGAALAVRRPRNLIPWLLMTTGLGFLGFPVVVVLVESALADGSPPGWAPYVAWVGNWVWLLGYVGGAYLLLLFPTGTALSHRWRIVARLGAAYLVLMFIVLATYPDLEAAPTLDNPFAVPLLADREPVLMGFVVGLPVLQFLAVVCIVLRAVRSRGNERLQMKWMALAASTLLVLLVALNLGAPRWLQAFPTLALVAAVVVAVTRYRLYEIDRILSRTLTYVVVTTLLAAIYVVGIVGLGGLIHRSSGDSGSELIVAASTLAVAALFQPLRRRVQRSIDQRFNRDAYDAQRMVSRFGQRLRDEVNLGTLSAEMCAITDQAVHPSQVSVWLAPAGTSPSSRGS